MARAVGLDGDAIVAAALGIADAEGIEALSMRRLSAVLRVTPMAIYHHVDGKDALVDLVVDRSLRALPDLTPDGEPREFFLALHRLLVEHRALAQAMAARSLDGPVATVKADRVLAALRASGRDPDAAADAFLAAFGFVLGASLHRVSRGAAAARSFPGIHERRTPTAHDLRRRLSAGLDDAAVRRGLDRLLG